MAKGTDMKSRVSLTLAMTLAAGCFAFLAKAEAFILRSKAAV